MAKIAPINAPGSAPIGPQIKATLSNGKPSARGELLMIHVTNNAPTVAPAAVDSPIMRFGDRQPMSLIVPTWTDAGHLVGVAP